MRKMRRSAKEEACILALSGDGWQQLTYAVHSVNHTKFPQYAVHIRNIVKANGLWKIKNINLKQKTQSPARMQDISGGLERTPVPYVGRGSPLPANFVYLGPTCPTPRSAMAQLTLETPLNPADWFRVRAVPLYAGRNPLHPPLRCGAKIGHAFGGMCRCSGDAACVCPCVCGVVPCACETAEIFLEHGVCAFYLIYFFKK